MPNLRPVRILDKYLFREVLVPTLYCFDAFAMLWIVIDLFDNLPDFIEYQAGFGLILQYYFVALPELIVTILPMSLLLGLLWCLSNMGRYNELTAMRASGVSLVRVATPALGIGLVASLLVFGVNEMFVPRSKERADSLLNRLKGRSSKQIIQNFFFYNPALNRYWYVSSYDTGSDEMENPEIHEDDESGQPVRSIYAERAHWHDRTWHFYGVKITDYTRSPPEVIQLSRTNFPSFQEKPSQFAMASRKPSQLYSEELRRYIRALRRTGQSAQLNTYRVELHGRYAFPLTCLMVVWIGVPLGMKVSRSGPLLSIGTALLLVVGYYFLTHLANTFGGGGYIPPALAAWLPNLTFVAIGSALIWRAR
jgi:lipopolysaccharide export system permease protein